MDRFSTRKVVMKDELVQIHDFPNYGISEGGFVWNYRWERYIKRSPNQSGLLTVRLNRDYSQHVLTVSRLVMYHWSDEDWPDHYNTIVYRDGNRDNCHVDNLIMRPRWFAIQYHQQINSPPKYNSRFPITIEETGEVFRTARDCAMTYGILPNDIFSSALTGKRIFPNHWNARFVKLDII